MMFNWVHKKQGLNSRMEKIETTCELLLLAYSINHYNGFLFLEKTASCWTEKHLEPPAMWRLLVPPQYDFSFKHRIRQNEWKSFAAPVNDWRSAFFLTLVPFHFTFTGPVNFISSVLHMQSLMWKITVCFASEQLFQVFWQRANVLNQFLFI